MDSTRGRVFPENVFSKMRPSVRLSARSGAHISGIGRFRLSENDGFGNFGLGAVFVLKSVDSVSQKRGGYAKCATFRQIFFFRDNHSSHISCSVTPTVAKS